MKKYLILILAIVIASCSSDDSANTINEQPTISQEQTGQTQQEIDEQTISDFRGRLLGKWKSETTIHGDTHTYDNVYHYEFTADSFKYKYDTHQSKGVYFLRVLNDTVQIEYRSPLEGGGTYVQNFSNDIIFTDENTFISRIELYKKQ